MDYAQTTNAPAQPHSKLPVRQLHVDLSQGFARHWFGGDAFRSAYYNALSMSFPAGEQLFIDSVKNALAVLPDTPEHAALRAQCIDFSAQEATHRHVHAQYNAVLERQGLKNRIESRIWARFKRVENLITPRHHLAVTAAYEHYTAVLAHITLARPEMMASAAPEMQNLWRWHALEETEHKAVAFDLYYAIGGNHRWRVRWFLFASFQFFFDALRQTTNNLWHDGTLFHPRTWASAAQFFFGRPSRGGGWTWLTVGPLLRYLRKDFHPWQDDNLQIAQDWASNNAHLWRVVR
jgi:uncharacterized protein